MVLNINDVRYKMSIIEHSNCGNYIYSKEVIDNTAEHQADVVITWLILMVMFAHEYVMRSTCELTLQEFHIRLVCIEKQVGIHKSFK